ncbi:MAG: MOSC domain-containing protein [Phaeodactylibacter sp.]|nr:MOSC domain-containing protein [Phaeodactylibacter sp.]
MKLTALYTYPIKGLAGVYLPKARVEARGLAYDRRWMLVDRDGLFLSQRELPKLVLLKPDFTVSGISINNSAERSEPLLIPFHTPEPEQRLEVQVWDYRCKAVPVSRQADEWFSEALKVHCRLVFMPDDVERPVKGDHGLPGEITGFSDSCPLLIVGEASLAALNEHFDEPFSIARFRPNIVFSAGQPHAEDHWESFRIGALLFRGIRRCGRCQVINVNPETGEPGKNPLRTLGTYRREGHKTLFGMYASLSGAEEGFLQVGDEVEVLTERP